MNKLKKAASTTLGSVVEQRVIEEMGPESGLKHDAQLLGVELDLKWSVD